MAQASDLILSKDELWLLATLATFAREGRAYLIEQEAEPPLDPASIDSLLELGLLLKVVVRQHGRDREALTLADYELTARLLRGDNELPEVGDLGPRFRPSALAERALTP
jgi:hypothetical protein